MPLGKGANSLPQTPTLLFLLLFDPPGGTVMQRATLAVMLLVTPAAAQQGMITVQGTATLGDATFPARFAFGCTGNAPGATGTLAVELHVTGYDRLRTRFDLDAFEGPDANAGRRTRIGPSREAAEASQPLAVAGWISGGVENAFAFGLSGAIRGDTPRLRAVRDRIAPALDQGRIAWIQADTRRGGTPIIATATIDAESQAHLRDRLAPCLQAAGHRG